MTLRSFKRFVPIFLVTLLQLCIIVGLPTLRTALHLSFTSFLGMVLLGATLHGFLIVRAVRYARERAPVGQSDVNRTTVEK